MNDEELDNSILGVMATFPTKLFFCIFFFGGGAVTMNIGCYKGGERLHLVILRDGKGIG
jgi:hypothetical protein